MPDKIIWLNHLYYVKLKQHEVATTEMATKKTKLSSKRLITIRRSCSQPYKIIRRETFEDSSFLTILQCLRQLKSFPTYNYTKCYTFIIAKKLKYCTICFVKRPSFTYLHWLKHLRWTEFTESPLCQPYNL